jgi:uncharacterized protein (DUF433 family)
LGIIRGSLIIHKLKEGASQKELLEAYPRLSKEDIRAAILYSSNGDGG